MSEQPHSIYHQPVPLLKDSPDYIEATTDTWVPCVCLCIGPDTQLLPLPIGTSSPGAFLEHPAGTRASDPILFKALRWGAPTLVGCYSGCPKDQGLGPYSQSLLRLPSCPAAWVLSLQACLEPGQESRHKVPLLGQAWLLQEALPAAPPFPGSRPDTLPASVRGYSRSWWPPSGP